MSKWRAVRVTAANSWSETWPAQHAKGNGVRQGDEAYGNAKGTSAGRRWGSGYEKGRGDNDHYRPKGADTDKGKGKGGGKATDGFKGNGKAAGKGAGKTNGKAGGTRPAPLESRTHLDSLPVAIVGGGLSGLCCGWSLRQHGIDAVILDTGKRGPGGRASSRVLESGGGQQVVDHAVQAFTAQGAEVNRLIASMASAGAVRPWKGTVGTLSAGGTFSPWDEASGGPLWIGSARDGIGAMSNWLAHGQRVVQDSWVARLEALDSGAWALLDQRGRRVGDHAAYSYVVMAHNGKCADRLIKTASFVTDAHASLRCCFTSQASQSSDRLELSSIFACVVEAPRGVAAFEGAFIEDNEVLSWAGNNSCKYPQASSGSRADTWTLISTPRFGSANKCPQENIPPHVWRKVSHEMCAAFAGLIGADASSWHVQHLQQSGAALPLNTCAQHFVLDPQARVGVCGDWLTSPCVEGALFSGLSMAEALRRDLKSGGLDASGVRRFHGVAGCHALGSFGDCDPNLTAAGVVAAVGGATDSRPNESCAGSNAH